MGEPATQRPCSDATSFLGGRSHLPYSAPGGLIPLLLPYAPTPSVTTRSNLNNGRITMALGVPPSILGLIVSGDVDGITIYTDRYNRKVAYPKAPPKEPPTKMQVDVRNRFKAAQSEYMGLTPLQKQAYELLTKAASLCLTGQNLFISVAMKRTYGILDTLQLQTGISVTPPTPV